MEERHMNSYVYIGAVIVILGLILMFAGILSAKHKQKKAEATPEVTQEAQVETEEAEEPQEPETEAEEPVEEKEPTIEERITKLMENYYGAYASGDVDTLAKYAAPISELEKSYIGLMSKYTQSTENIQCYVTAGAKEGDYAVSVTADTRLEGASVTAPGLDFFYVRTNEAGSLYIDNAYCSFNTSVHVTEVDEDVMAFITEYESQEEFKALQSSVQEQYDAILESNPELKEKLATEIPQVVNNWMDDLGKKSETKTKDVNNVVPGAKLNADDTFHIRESMKDGAKKIGTTKKGDEITVIENYPDGWTKVKWKGEKGYVKTKLLIENE